MKNIKKISFELLKSYVGMTVTFIIFNIILLSAFWKYLLSEAEKDIRRSYNVITIELKEDENKKDINHFYKDISTELPASRYITPIFEIDGKVYGNDKEKQFFDFKRYPVNQYEVVGFYKYIVMRRELATEDGKVIDMLLLKNLKTEKRIIIKLIKIVSVGGLIVLVLGLLRTKCFYNKFIAQIIELVERTDNQIEFVNNASHELKTPIFIIKGYVDLMKRWGLKDQEVALESLNAIQEEVKAMESLVEKLLFIAKNDKIKPFLEEVELSEVFVDILTEMKIIYPEQEFLFNPKEIRLFTDWALLKQLLRNIIDNAIKYGRGNLIEIFTEEEQENIKIIVKDRGVGLSSQELEKIFDKFYRADPSRNKNIKGHGLGLSISKTILEILNGKIKFESIPDVGTIVMIWIRKNKRQSHN